jgi:hypothetical protein
VSGQGRTALKPDILADRECVGPAAICRLRNLGADIADEIGRRGRIFRVDPDQHTVERRHRVNRRKRRLAMAVEARRRIGRDHVSQHAACFGVSAATAGKPIDNRMATPAAND